MSAFFYVVLSCVDSDFAIGRSVVKKNPTKMPKRIHSFRNYLRFGTDHRA
jgi:hypothetical protein